MRALAYTCGNFLKRWAPVAIMLLAMLALMATSTAGPAGAVPEAGPGLVMPAAVPGPKLISPAPGVHTTGDPDDPAYLSGDRVLYEPLGIPLFLWEPVPGVTKYKLQINVMPDFSGFMAVDKADLAYTGYAPTAGTPLQDWKADSSTQHPQEDKLYYWRVGAYDPSTYSWVWSDTRYFTRHWGYVPQHLAPADMTGTDEYFEAEPMFQWSAIPGASFYELQISSNEEFATPYAFYTRQTYYVPYGSPLPNEASYYWRVRAYSFNQTGMNANSGAPGLWSCTAATAVVDTDCPMFRILWSYYHAKTGQDRRPQPLTPPNNAENVGLPLFSWTPVEGAAEYELEICTEPSCVAGDKLRIGSSPSTYDQTPNTFWDYKMGDFWPLALKTDTIYYWRVRACRVKCGVGQFGQWTSDPPSASRLYSFKTAPTGIPPAPALFYPSYYYTPTVQRANFEDRTVAQPTFMWNRVYSATSYIIQVTDPVRYPNFEQRLWEAQTRNLSIVPTASVPITRGIFAWRVSANGGASWSEIWRTRIDATSLGGATPANQPPRLLRVPYGVSEDSRTYGYESIDNFPLLEWLPVEGAAGYHVQIALEASFGAADIVHEGDTLFTNYTPREYCPPSLPPQAGCRLGWGTYYWRVRALGVAGGYSEPYMFIVSKPLRYIPGHTAANQTGSWERAILAVDAEGDAASPELDLGNLYVGVNKDHWLVGFEAQPGLDPVAYTLLLDTNQAVGAGATRPPSFSGITISLPHQPEFAIVGTVVSTTGVFTPTLYTWQRDTQSWDVGRRFDFISSRALYDAAAGIVELRLNRTALQTVEDPSSNPPSIAFSLFSSEAGGGTAGDVVPDSPNPSGLTRFAMHSQAPTPVLPPAQVITGNVIVRQTPVMRWHTMDDVYNNRKTGTVAGSTYRGRVAIEYGFSNIYQPNPIDSSSKQEGWMPNTMTFSPFNSHYIPFKHTYADNTYYWDVAPVVWDLDQSQNVELPYGQVYKFSKTMYPPLDPHIASNVYVSDSITYTNQVPALGWSSAQGAKGYRLLILQGGTSPIVLPEHPASGAGTINTTMALINSLKMDSYTWQVQTMDAWTFASQTTYGGGFTVIYPKVEPLYPKPGQLSNPFLFAWKLAEGAAYYELQIDPTDQFSSASLDTYRSFNIYFVPPKVPKAFQFGSAFYWRVRACTGHGDTCGVWTLVFFDIPMTKLDIAGPTQGMATGDNDFTACVTPITATKPITYIWQATGQAPVTQTVQLDMPLTQTVSYNWPEGEEGVKLITVTAMNSASTLSATHTITISPKIAPQSVTIHGPTRVNPGVEYQFTAVVAPADTSVPLRFEWKGQVLKSVDHTVYEIRDSASFTWTELYLNMDRDIQLTVSNVGGSVFTTHRVKVTNEPVYAYSIYIPLALKNK
ncbi:MAG: hypothetical protein JW850_04960 [Thermoflexales bacterium]|nr:hypothetical protein [Thermoflexales bacterium]